MNAREIRLEWSLIFFKTFVLAKLGRIRVTFHHSNNAADLFDRGVEDVDVVQLFGKLVNLHQAI